MNADIAIFIALEAVAVVGILAVVATLIALHGPQPSDDVR
jgi:hypothetical protein